MFERFTEGARRAVVQAQEEAAGLGHEHIGTEHLLLAVLARPEDPAAAVLVEAGLDHATARQAVRRLLGEGGDAQALASIGVDLDAVRDAVESVFGAGALDAPVEEAEPRRRGWFRSDAKGRRAPFTARARKVVELSLRESLRLKSGHIGVGHLLLGVIREGEGLGAKVIADHGLDFAALRRAIEAKTG
ncbi:Clp protease N-terminal domain-containing protein [Kitasatospora sp. CM 4170]|uniref:Clp protease N-terminal domain-containing protein n=1 Tax=Kitasatospora aburaviensis TaxID=67265 RepID=A0ABW1F465_9ACTN|nr:Clp protease N-terminal domain-containing protein [Kitasatospora sp. CM 4170]WNM47932.1 Clp protease N-terminal domain-containing protein [Kitasatospora sp. CM 4170]